MKRRALPMALTVVVAAAVVIGGLTFSRFVQESLWQESVTDVLEVTSQGRHALDAYLGTCLLYTSFCFENARDDPSPR